MNSMRAINMLAARSFNYRYIIYWQKKIMVWIAIAMATNHILHAKYIFQLNWKRSIKFNCIEFGWMGSIRLRCSAVRYSLSLHHFKWNKTCRIWWQEKCEKNLEPAILWYAWNITIEWLFDAAMAPIRKLNQPKHLRDSVDILIRAP